ncbi:hypothetical protein DUNSADRAFT_826 [Dunaliella salina]|uniref:Uncharacterized protein n=1 Tax=Dunaliella salina TaxID=3046 RepID=A0ABQ7GXU3_DUNSA|nr:hypothetical protein DUNSADRAFT_826 [Dunaliella salina]|eukprot:KAF5839424.1 hypothetical protein DUNSADRAFT_826 [Dunaliella salina]
MRPTICLLPQPSASDRKLPRCLKSSASYQQPPASVNAVQCKSTAAASNHCVSVISLSRGSKPQSTEGCRKALKVAAKH